MTDRKSQAAGEHDDDDDYLQSVTAQDLPKAKKRAEPEEDQPVKFDRGRIVKCERCKGEKKYFDACPGCPEFNKQTCICGHLAGDHGFRIGTRAKREIWVCRGCLSRPSESRINDICMDLVCVPK